MPGLLKPAAVCPVCGDGLDALTDTASAAQVEREYYHARRVGFLRRRPACVAIFPDIEAAQAERRALEVAR